MVGVAKNKVPDLCLGRMSTHLPLRLKQHQLKSIHDKGKFSGQLGKRIRSMSVATITLLDHVPCARLLG